MLTLHLILLSLIYTFFTWKCVHVLVANKYDDVTHVPFRFTVSKFILHVWIYLEGRNFRPSVSTFDFFGLKFGGSECWTFFHQFFQKLSNFGDFLFQKNEGNYSLFFNIRSFGKCACAGIELSTNVDVGENYNWFFFHFKRSVRELKKKKAAFCIVLFWLFRIKRRPFRYFW